MILLCDKYLLKQDGNFMFGSACDKDVITIIGKVLSVR